MVKYSGGILLYQKTGSESISYYYNGDGQVTAMKLTNTTYPSGITYYYQRNIQGDILALFDNQFNIVAKYVYDSWGKLISIKDGSENDISNDTSSVGYKNPLRYRGYYYDNEGGLYYLQSRYYNPEIGRFLNADGLVSTGQGLSAHNMFAYCNNNAVMYSDPDGRLAVVVAAAGGISVAILAGLAVVAAAATVAAVIQIVKTINAYGDTTL